MIAQQQVAKHLLLLVCLLVLNCVAQPLARLATLNHLLSTSLSSSHHAQLQPLQRSHLHSSLQSAQSTTRDEVNSQADNHAHPTSCQLNGKWLTAATLLCVEPLFFAIALVIILLVPLLPGSPTLPPPRNISPPERRLHLTLCVWRE
ncbi:MAG: hypothetical protein ACRC9M_10690 [Aeromonas sp.]